MKNVAFASIAQLKDALKNKEFTHQELLDYFIKRFEKYDGELGSALEIFNKESIAKSCTLEGLLSGIPGLIKDNICQKGRITSCASKILQNFYATYDATASNRLKNAGSFLLGRANCDEFAMGSSGEYSAYKLTHNPWNKDRVPGGSSSGSAAAVAAGLVPYALGSETGGSVRLPAAFCGIVGLKPTYGLVSRYGLVAYGSSLDQIGICTRTVDDCAQVLSVIAGHDVHDATSLTVDKKDYAQGLSGAIKPGLKIGIIENALDAEGIDPEIKKSLEDVIAWYEKQGAIIVRKRFDTMKYAAAVYFILSRAEAASNLARFDGVRYGLREKADTLNDMYIQTRKNGFGQEVKARILIGNYALSVGHADEFYDNAQKVRRLMRKEYMDAFKDVDVLFSPVHAMPAFKFGSFADNKLQMDLQDSFTCAANLVGIPAISIPCGFTSEKLPIGYQLMGPELSEALLLQTAHAYERQHEWHTMQPPGFE